jgi:two-component system chemotaxis sensor kinase CheA
MLKDKINDVAFMLVMVHESDPTTVEIVMSLCNEVLNLAIKTPGNERLVEATQFIVAQGESPQLVSLLNQYVSAATAFTEGDSSVPFPNEANASGLSSISAASVSDDDCNVDRTFLAEYIETHTLGLEELEGTTLGYVQGQIEDGDFVSSTKAYLHNLKGDSGSIGMASMERVCHILEDSINDLDTELIAANLMLFKHWASTFLEAFANGKTPPENADCFLQKCCCINPRQISAPTSATQTSIPAPAKRSDSFGNYTLAGENEILVEFVTEAEEHLNNVEGVILDAEGNYSRDSIDTIFRGVHSLKGGSAYFEIQEMTKVSHILENYLSEVRDGKRTIDATLSSLLLKYIDIQKEVLSRAKKTSCGDSMTWSDASQAFLKALEEYGQGTPASSSSPATHKNVDAENSRPKNEAIREDDKPSPPSNEDAESGEKLSIKTYVKVDTARLDLLIDSIGEMVIYSSMLIKHCRELLPSHENVMDATHRVEKFARDLQDIGMSMRLIPIKGLFQKMSRLVWDVGRKLGKEVVFQTEGEDTELADPLMHMVRNSMDHGIEATEERLAKGKTKAGKVKLSAFHAGGSIHIRISDDGRGLNPDKLIQKAVEKGIITEGQKLSQEEAFHLIFAPGFSTAAAVTDISGRGVGMDVVRRNVENLRGRISITSEVDKGSTFTIEIPLTLAILDGIQTRVGIETFVIPSLSILEFVRPQRGMITHTLDRGETLNLRGMFLPVYRLGRLFGFESEVHSPQDSTMVIVQSNNDVVALMVDEILGECSTVIKSLGGMFENQEGITGCAIMPGGNIALILDMPSLIVLARKSYRFDPYQDVIDSSIEYQH